MPEIVFDIETIGDIRNQELLRVTVVSIYDYGVNSYHSFEESELDQLWPILEQADRLIGYNSLHFDIPILNKYYKGDLASFPNLDLLKAIKESSGSRFKLNDIAKATLQTEKSADGLQAEKWYLAGEIQKVKDYCEQDVRVTKELYEFGRKNRMLYYPTLTGEIMPIAVNFEPQPVSIAKTVAEKNLNLTLPI